LYSPAPILFIFDHRESSHTALGTSLVSPAFEKFDTLGLPLAALGTLRLVLYVFKYWGLALYNSMLILLCELLELLVLPVSFVSLATKAN
jgi:hypothetical protein